MPKVKINSVDYQWFAEAAEAAGTSVDQWLAEAGRAQALTDAHGLSRVVVPSRGSGLSKLWGEALVELAGRVRSPEHLSYLMRTELHAVLNDTALMTAEDAFTRDVVESRLRAPVAEVLGRRLNRPVHVAVTLRQPPAPPSRSDLVGSEAGKDQDTVEQIGNNLKTAEKMARQLVEGPKKRS